jgi:ribosomal protein L11 methyltransferase
MPGHLELSFRLGALDSQAAEEAAFALGAAAVTFVDACDEPVLEPAPGEFRLWRDTTVRCLFPQRADVPVVLHALATALGLSASELVVTRVGERVWEREWLKDFHALRFGKRLWVCPHHEQVSDPAAAVVKLDPGLAFGTGTHPSTALCLDWLDAHLSPGVQVIDYGCGSGILALAAARLGAASVHAFDIDPQALLATRENAHANALMQIQVHEDAATLPEGVDLVLANILSGPLCALAARFAALVRRGGRAVLAGLMTHEVADVTGAYAACFDVAACGSRDEWVCLAARRR